jgi:FAD/FMN-containing dehydrogenase
LDEVVSACGESCVLDPSLHAGFEVDWTGRWHGRAAAVLRPRGTDAVRQMVLAARHHGVALVPRGGGTGLVGGAVPTATGDQVVLDMSALQHLELDPVAATAVVGAGVTLEQLNDAARPHGLRFAVDIGSRGSATVVGMVCTNAGGLRMLRLGDTSSQLLGVEMVTGAGELVSQMRGLTKDNVGLRWHKLVAGSEGSLGVVCAVVVAMNP